MELEGYKNTEQFPSTNDTDEELHPVEELNHEFKSAEGPELETPLEPLEVEEPEVADDPVRLYLHEIGKVHLLTAQDERVLARKIEAAKRIREITQDYLSKHGKSPSATDIVLTMLKETGEAAPIIRLLQKELDLAPTASLIQSISESGLHDSIGGVMNQQLIQANIKREAEKAERHLIEANLRLVVSVAKKHVGRGMSLLDLIQEGNIGLIRAVEKFDYHRGYKFSTYATWWIRQAITRAIADQARTIRVPVHMIETINKLLRVSRRLAQEHGRDPNPREIGKKMDLPPEKVREIVKVAQLPVSLESPIGEEEDSHLSDFIEDRNALPPVDAASKQLLKEQIDEVLSHLTPREQRVLVLRFGLEDGRSRTLEEVGQEFNVTRERIRQIEAKALRKLRHPSRSRKLKDYLE